MMLQFDVIILAAGSSYRMGGHDKLLLPIGNDSVLSRTISAFYNHPRLRKIIIVISPSQKDIAHSIVSPLDITRFSLATGGDTRTQSVENGLAYAKAPITLIHDGARPFVSNDLIDRLLTAVQQHGSAIPALPIADSVRKVHGGQIVDIADRDSLYAVQTPQAFLTETIISAYSMRGEQVFSDDSEVYAKFISPPYIIKGDNRNTKITTMGDYYGLNSKIGYGYDIHNFAEDKTTSKALVLAGIKIPYERSLQSHSDGDVVIHALIDAMLSAIGERDIGYLFPDNDIAYKDIESTVLLQNVIDMYCYHNYKINNIAITIIADYPYLSDYIPLMQSNLAKELGIPNNTLSIMATTSEGNSPNAIAVHCMLVIN